MNKKKSNAIDLKTNPDADLFIDKVRELNEEQLRALFDPKITEGDLRWLTEQQILDKEDKARNDTQKRLFRKLMGQVEIINPDVKGPMLNDDLKSLVINALNIAHENAKSEEEKADVMKKIAAVNHVSPFTQEKEVNLNSDKPKPSVSAQLSVKKEDGYNFHPFVDRSEKAILNSLKNHGYKTLVKDDNKGIRKFVNNEGKGIDISKTGDMKCDPIGFDQDVKKLAMQSAENFVAMMLVRYDVAKKEGMALAFPTGPVNLSITANGLEDTPENKKKFEEINKLAQEQVKYLVVFKHAMTLGSMLDQFTYDGKKMEMDPNKTMRPPIPEDKPKASQIPLPVRAQQPQENNRRGFRH